MPWPIGLSTFFLVPERGPDSSWHFHSLRDDLPSSIQIQVPARFWVTCSRYPDPRALLFKSTSLPHPLEELISAPHSLSGFDKKNRVVMLPPGYLLIDSAESTEGKTIQGVQTAEEENSTRKLKLYQKFRNVPVSSLLDMLHLIKIMWFQHIPPSLAPE